MVYSLLSLFKINNADSATTTKQGSSIPHRGQDPFIHPHIHLSQNFATEFQSQLYGKTSSYFLLTQQHMMTSFFLLSILLPPQ